MSIPLHCQKPEDIFKCSAAEIAAMSDVELNELFAPCLAITRPELAKQRQEDSDNFMKDIVKKSGSKATKSSMSAEEAFAKAQQFALKLGIKV